MHIAICEDDALDADTIRTLLEEYLEQHAYVGEISVFNSGEELLASFSLGLYDVILFDIFLGTMSGIDTARHIRAIDPTCAIIFITSSKDFSLESYSVQGSAYVVKPISKESLEKALFTCREIFMRNARYIEIRVDRTMMKLPLTKIFYAESRENNVLFHTSAGEFKTRTTLDEIERQLGGKPFYRCHHSYLINTNHVLRLAGNDILMRNQDFVPMRKAGRDTIREELIDLLSARMFESS